MQFWQNQLNFAVWCATTGCGVSVEDHLPPDDGLLQSVYRFHVCYQIRRILEEIQAPLPYDETWNAMKNSYDRKGYEKICDEFGVSPNSDWKVSGPNQGFGQAFNYFPGRGYCLIGDGEFLPGKMSFTQKANDDFHVDYIKQETDAVSRAWRLFMLNKSDGLTRPGVERLADSIQTYVWSVLTAQVQIPTGILGTGAAFRAQTQFKTNVETAIASPVDAQAAIIRYQDVVQNASSEVNFSFGEGLVMAPGDLLLRIGKIVGYNNNIIVATSLNKGLNKSVAPPRREKRHRRKGASYTDGRRFTVRIGHREFFRGWSSHSLLQSNCIIYLPRFFFASSNSVSLSSCRRFPMLSPGLVEGVMWGVSGKIIGFP